MPVRILALMLITAALTFSAQSATIRVPLNQPTIGQGISAAVTGDTILVAPGSYAESLDFNGKAIHLISEAGSESTILTGGILIEDLGSKAAEIKGFSLRDTYGSDIVQILNSSPTISDNVFAYNTGTECIILCYNASPTITRNLFHHNTVGSACVGVTYGPTRIINNTFDTNSRGFFSLGSETIAQNNIVTNSAQYGIFGSFESLDYNNVWNNGNNYDHATPGPSDISADPLFVSPALLDFRIQYGSPCIDAGNPSEEFVDPDGTINDLGAYYTSANLPRASWIKVGNTINQRVTETFPVIAWTYLDSATMLQQAFELQIGADRNWSTAELWVTGEVTSPDTSIRYSGPPLVDGATYWGRIRVSNGTMWGEWSEFGFRLNQAPGPLTTFSPVAGATLSPTGVWLQVYNSVDLDLDPLDYTYEVYSDPELLQLVATKSMLKSRNGVTYSELVTGLEASHQYWWRAKVTDGYETTLWSATSFFSTKLPLLIRVPHDQPTIQTALNSAADGDTVLVAPGVYRELLDFPNHSVKLIAEGGPAVTFLARPVDANHMVATINFHTPVTREAEVSGFTMSDESAHHLIDFDYGAEAVLKGNIFRDLNCEHAIITTGQGDPLISQNVFVNDSLGWYCIEALGPCEILNNTFDHNRRGVFSIDWSATFFNNIVSNSTEIGIAGSFRAHDYNIIWQNHPDYDISLYGTLHELAVSPAYVDSLGGDYRLTPGSPSIDAGNPQARYNDPDGSRNDLGAFPYYDHFPSAHGIVIGESGNLHVVDATPRITWKYFDKLGLPQEKLEIQIGTDLDWSQSEMWNTGELISNLHSIEYAGAAIQPGQICIGRVRVSNGLDWGDWQEFLFRRNSAPQAPIPLSPVSGATAPCLDTRMELVRSFDAEGDSLRYEYEVYADDSLTALVTAESDLSGTIFPPTRNLLPTRVYWWRARASDGYEQSEWSVVATFSTRGGISYRVPSSYASIQQAITAAHNGDTVLVAPGTYFESFDLLSKALIITSSAGPELTSLTPPRGASILFSSLEIPASFGISGFTVRGHNAASVIRISGDLSPKIENMRFLNNHCTVVIQVQSGSPTINHNLFVGNVVGSACIGVDGGGPIIENNTFSDNLRGVYSFSTSTIARNNIVASSSEYGFFGWYGSLDYNDVWLNHPDYVHPEQVDAHNISVDPLFRSIQNEDFRLSVGSLCIDAGDPAPYYNDSDGTRNDLGAYPLNLQHPTAFDLLDPINGLSAALTTVTPTFRWSASAIPHPLGPLTYTLKIASDSAFEFVRTIADLDSNLCNLTSPLNWGTRYWWKVRADIEGEGETWSNETFTFRTQTLGDTDGSGKLNIADIVFLVNYIFAGGRPPAPIAAGDLNCSGTINIGDAVYLVNYLFASGPLPCAAFASCAPALGPDKRLE